MVSRRVAVCTLVLVWTFCEWMPFHALRQQARDLFLLMGFVGIRKSQRHPQSSAHTLRVVRGTGHVVSAATGPVRVYPGALLPPESHRCARQNNPAALAPDWPAAFPCRYPSVERGQRGGERGNRDTREQRVGRDLRGVADFPCAQGSCGKSRRTAASPAAGCVRNAFLISPRKRDRIMQPPFHIIAIPP